MYWAPTVDIRCTINEQHTEFTKNDSSFDMNELINEKKNKEIVCRIDRLCHFFIKRVKPSNFWL